MTTNETRHAAIDTLVNHLENALYLAHMLKKHAPDDEAREDADTLVKAISSAVSAAENYDAVSA